MKKFLAMILSIFMILLNLSRCEGRKLSNPNLTSDIAKTSFETDFSKSDSRPILVIKGLFQFCKKLLSFQFKLFCYSFLFDIELLILSHLIFH
jgi:hypothetical protein